MYIAVSSSRYIPKYIKLFYSHHADQASDDDYLTMKSLFEPPYGDLGVTYALHL